VCVDRFPVTDIQACSAETTQILHDWFVLRKVIFTKRKDHELGPSADWAIHTDYLSLNETSDHANLLGHSSVVRNQPTAEVFDSEVTQSRQDLEIS
jgi:hypothetical protein